MKVRISTKTIAITAIFTAITALITGLGAIPLPSAGFLNIGDTIILLCAGILGPLPAMFIGGVGGMFGDLLASFAVYAPITLVAKALEGLVAGVFMQLILGRVNKKFIQILLSIPALAISGMLMASTYAIAEWIMYGGGVAITNLPFNIIQAVICVVLAILLIFAARLLFLAEKFGFAYNGILKRKSKTKESVNNAEK